MKVSFVAASLACVLLGLEGTVAFAPASGSSRRPFTGTSTLFESPEPLETEGDWSAFLDLDSYGVVYYFNTRTGESRWEPPTKTFPTVYLKPSLRRQAEEKKAEYYQSLEGTEEKKKGNFLTKLLEPKEAAEVAAEEPVAEKEPVPEKEAPQWMQGISRFANNKPGSNGVVSSSSESSPVSTPAKEESANNVFNKFFSSVTADAEAGTENKAEKVARERAEKAKAKDEEARIKADAAVSKKKEAQDKKLAEQKRAAEAKQKAEAERLETKAKKVIEDSKKSESEAKAAKAKRDEAEAEAKAAKAKRAEAALKAVESAKPGATISLFGLEIELPSLSMSAPKKTEEKIIVAETQAPIRIDMSTFVLPHPSKVMWGGEDAVFVKGRTFGVFDGVSGADKTDGLPLYSKMLAREMSSLVGTGNDLTIKEMQSQLLTAAEMADVRATGASTAIVGSITEDGFLRAINLGDSVCIVIRDGKVVAKTKEIVHYFDCPYQLSDISPDRPRDARKLNFELVRGDVVVMGSDGIFDNLDESEIIKIVASSENANTIAKTVSDRSRKVSLDSQAATPYGKAAQRNGDPDYKSGLGGKVDDISCVVVRYV